MIVDEELRRRVRRPQRHRLLHGYPMAPLLRPIDDGPPPYAGIELDASRPLIVGVLPHTFCNPAVRGCGFCTFPHEKYSNEEARRVVSHVVGEVHAMTGELPELRDRRVDALYFGGGTANLTPPDSLRELGAALTNAFDLSNAEVTLEGVPRYFAIRNDAMLDVLSGMPVRHRRISMGVQTFDPEWLARMGRSAFGTPDEIAGVVHRARERGFTTSCDLLFNLPGQSLAACLEDISRACAMGFDQICTYNLVLEAGMETEWSRSRSLLAAVPDNEQGVAHWLAVRQTLLAARYVQTTLTNFERADVRGTPHEFRYEQCSFRPAQYDGLGFGPGALSTFTDRHRQTAVKWMNEPTAATYVDARNRRAATATRSFHYTLEDLRLLHITRQLALMAVDRHAYAGFFGTDVIDDFPKHVAALAAARLVRVSESDLSVTPQGMFYADAIAGLFASERARLLRSPNDSVPHAMG